ncbi:MAG: L-seryl-tRNA(Sec) selenium transferase [Calditrichaceae bacterium]|nr:L-seryl-tRNA(Sec) selenium transferase [Calditrichaceae bacterium]
MTNSDILSKLPAVHILLDMLRQKYPQIKPVILKRLINLTLTSVRENPQKYFKAEVARSWIEEKILNNLQAQINDLIEGSLKKVINATGVILHTGLGRAPLLNTFIETAGNISGYTNLEINLDTGKRGERNDHLSRLIRILTGAEDGFAVNNNAAAVMLMLNTVGKGREIILSRGEMIEIGGSFRLPEVMRISGCKLKEVGTTNKTHFADYAEAISPRTAGILICHTSNYEIQGFTEKPELSELVELAHKNNLPVIYDLGSGSMLPSEFYGTEGEPEIAGIVNSHVDLISFSGDKLLGGPQAGIIAGKKEWVKKCSKNHLLRALRLDKIMIKILQQTLIQYLFDQPVPDLESLKMIKRNPAEIKSRLSKFTKALPGRIQSQIEIVESTGKIGSGAFPLFEILSAAIQINSTKISAAKLARSLRQWRIPIFTKIINDTVQLDFRTVQTELESEIKEALLYIL